MVEESEPAADLRSQTGVSLLKKMAPGSGRGLIDRAFPNLLVPERGLVFIGFVWNV